MELEDGSGEEYEVLYDAAGEIVYAEYENAGSQISAQLFIINNIAHNFPSFPVPVRAG